MAQKKKQPAKTTKPKAAKASASDTTVTRITATDDAPAKKQSTSKNTVPAKKPAAAEVAEKTEKKTRKNPLRAIGGYFKGAWYEIRQVRWPNRKATWSLTLAVLIFTGFFVLLIVLLDTLFQYLFEQILA